MILQTLTEQSTYFVSIRANCDHTCTYELGRLTLRSIQLHITSVHDILANSCYLRALLMLYDLSKFKVFKTIIRSLYVKVWGGLAWYADSFCAPRCPLLTQPSAHIHTTFLSQPLTNQHRESASSP